MIEKEFIENVCGEDSTHAIIRKVGEEIVYDLIIVKDGCAVKTLATDRTWSAELIPLTDEELECL
jgi:hypothetical protein